MLISFDKTNFPMAVIEEAGVEVHLLPITKAQFELFVDESPLLKQAQYKEMLALNPAASADDFEAAEREQLFVSGVLPDEARLFARWLGKGFDLPTVFEWRAVMAALKREPTPRKRLLADALDGTSRTIIEAFEEQLHIRSMLDYSLMRGGLVEWTRQGDDFAGLGTPRAEFHPNLWDPLYNTIMPLNLKKRLHYFGFRLVRRDSHYLSDRKTATYVF